MYHLVGGIPTTLKNMKVSWDYSSQYMEKIEFMFQTTNQSWHFEWPQTFWQGSDD